MKLDPNAPAYPQNPEWTSNRGGLSIRAELAARFAAAWAMAIGVRAHHNPDYDDEGAGIEANRLGLLQADHFINQFNESEATRAES